LEERRGGKWQGESERESEREREGGKKIYGKCRGELLITQQKEIIAGLFFLMGTAALYRVCSTGLR